MWRGNTENNPVLALTKAVVSAARVSLSKPLWKTARLRDQETRRLRTCRLIRGQRDPSGRREGRSHYGNYGLMAPILEAREASEDWKDVESKAYPVPVKVKVVKRKKVRRYMFAYSGVVCGMLYVGEGLE
jgi:hypothetical protein